MGLLAAGCERGPVKGSRSPRAVESETASEQAAGHARNVEAPETQVAPVKGSRQVAIVAGGCFWGVEEILRQHHGVLDTEVGYVGGSVEDPAYEAVHTGETGHAEAVRVEFDSDLVSYETLLRYFFRLHDPTTLNRQGNDRGTQYRSAIFVLNEEQRRVAEAVRADVDRSGKWDAPVVTEIVPAGTFFEAESYHQDYLQRNPNGYTCHYLRD